MAISCWKKVNGSYKTTRIYVIPNARMGGFLQKVEEKWQYLRPNYYPFHECVSPTFRIKH